MIISRTPFRISFAGGGSDFREFYQKEYGAVVSTTIDKYIYLSMHPLFNKKGFFLKYSMNENVENAEEIKHAIIKEIFLKYKMKGIDFNSSSDIPSGTGLGSSSSFTAGLINLCNVHNHIYISREDIAREACRVEIDKLRAPIGKQDQYAVSVGGMNFIRFNPDESVSVEKINLSEDKKQELEDSLILFYLGNTRGASSVLTEQKENISQKTSILKKMVILAENLRDEFKNDSIDRLGDILNAGWAYKKELSSNITNGAIDNWYDIAMQHGAKGGKVLGAGNGGFLLLFAPKGKAFLRAAMRLYELKFKFENTGTTIIY